MPAKLKYNTLEHLEIGRPVERVAFIASLCRDKIVLDIGCLDETAFVKRDTRHWLHGRIRTLARQVIGIDNSEQIPPEGLTTGPNAAIYRGNGMDPSLPQLCDAAIEIIIAGEFIEHIDSPLAFFSQMQARFAGRELVISTPNGLSFANTLMAMIRREAQHPDHLHAFTYKVLNTLCLRAGFADWQIIPYRFYATEMILTSRGVQRLAAQCLQPVVRIVEWLFPLLSFGYVIRISL
jgi:hypothetical protein